MRYSTLLFIAILLALLGCSGSATTDSADEFPETGGATTALATGGQAGAMEAGAGSPPTGGTDACPDGSEGCGCYGNSTCDNGLSCFSGLCVDAGAGGAGSGTGGVAACSWETATVIPASESTTSVSSSGCFVIGMTVAIGEPMYVVATSVEPFTLIQFDFENQCGSDYWAGLYQNRQLMMTGCPTLIELRGSDEVSEIGIRWWF